MANILLVEDDPAFAESVATWMLAVQHKVYCVTSGEEAKQVLSHSTFDIIIVDWELPGMSGYELVNWFRKKGGMTPVIFLTGREDVSSKSSGLDCGADDYIVKGGDLRELASRIRARLRRSGTLLPNVITIGEVKLDTGNGKVLIKGQAARLTKMEFAVLEFLMRHHNQVLSAKTILSSVWTSDSESSEGAVRQVLYALRRKLEIEGAGDLIKTMPGGGYIVEHVDTGHCIASD